MINKQAGEVLNQTIDNALQKRKQLWEDFRKDPMRYYRENLKALEDFVGSLSQEEADKFLERLFTAQGEAAIANAQGAAGLTKSNEPPVDAISSADAPAPAPAQDTNEKANLFERIFSPIGEGALANSRAMQELTQPEPKEKVKESDYRPTITEENGEKKITFSEGLFTRFMKDYSSMMITEYTKQPKTGQDPGPDPLYDMIRGKQGG